LAGVFLQRELSVALPDNPNDRSLLSIINIFADEKAYDGAKDFLCRMALPNPEENEFFLGPNVARIYLSEGLSVSFVFRKVNILAAAWSKLFPSHAVEPARIYAARKVKDDEILQPLYQEDLGPNCCVEIVPGLPRAKIAEREIHEIGERLSERKIDFYNRSAEFIGVVQTADGAERFLVTNRRALRVMPGFVQAAMEGSTWQDAHWGKLSAEFKAALGSGSADNVQRVMKECKDPSLSLVAYWRKTDAGTERAKSIVTSATNYERRLAAS